MGDHIRPVTASVVGLASDTRWGQVLQTPHAYGVVEVHAEDGVARTRGVHLLTKLTRMFDTPPVSLSALSDIADGIMGEDIVTLILLVPVGTTLYLLSRGIGCVYLKRGGKLAKLLEGTQALSGDVRTDDTVIAATAGFVGSLPERDIIGVFDHLSPAEVAEKLTIRLHERSGGEGGAALIFQMQSVAGQDDAREEQGVAETPVISDRRAIVVGNLKTFGRMVLGARHRAGLRRFVMRMRVHRAYSPRLLAVYVIVGLFVISVVLGIRRQMTMRAHARFSDVLVTAQHSFDEGMALLDLNPVKGRERLTASRDLLAPVVAQKVRTDEGIKIQALYDDVVENLTRAMRVTRVTPEVYFDMALLKSGATATDISLFQQTIGVLDAMGSTVFTVGTSVKNGAITGGGDGFAGATHVAAYGDKLYVFTPRGIHQIRLTDQKTVSAMIPRAPEWGTIADMAAFGGNLYLLDTAKSRIWKYVATGESQPAGRQGFSEIYEYLNPDTLPDLSRATSMVIDGSVWLGTSGGTILRFTSGKENSFVPQGVDTPLGNRLVVHTSDEMKTVYVLDVEHKRVVVLDKDGMYMAQYAWESAFVPTALAVSETSRKLFLLADGKIYVIGLK